MRKHQIVPLALLVGFATVLFLGIAFVQLDRKAANQELLEAQAKFETQRTTVVNKALEEPDENQFNIRWGLIDDEEDKAIATHQAALDRASFWQTCIMAAGGVMFIVFVGVTVYMARQAADD